MLGGTIQRVAGSVGIGLAILTVAMAVASTMSLRRYETQLAVKAERAYPGPLAPPGPGTRAGRGGRADGDTEAGQASRSSARPASGRALGNTHLNPGVQVARAKSPSMNS